MVKINLRKQKGITLVALVITIIVLLILAGVTLNIVLNSGIINKSENSVAKYQETSGNETEQINYLDAIFGNFLANVTATGTTTPSNPDTTPATPGTDNKTGTANVKLGSGNKGYNNPLVPVGFETVETTDASWALSSDGTIVADWNKGLVIQDGSGNQFVWVPVDGITGPNGVTYDTHYDTGTSAASFTAQSLPNSINDGTQVSENGGFYIGRYEAGIPNVTATATARTTASAAARNLPSNSTDAGIAPVVKKNEIPWNYISWTNAKKNSECMYATNYVQSVLTTEKMWDTTMQWLSLSTDPVTNTTINVTTDCRGWGNYTNAAVTNVEEYSTDYGASWTTNTATNKTKGVSTSWLLKTGHSDYTKRNNIYDLAGNLWEWTNSLKTGYSSYSSIRGGTYLIGGMDRVATCRGDCSLSDYSIGFRPVLLIK